MIVLTQDALSKLKIVTGFIRSDFFFKLSFLNQYITNGHVYQYPFSNSTIQRMNIYTCILLSAVDKMRCIG